MNCIYNKKAKNNICLLGKYDGSPTEEQCIQCIANNQNHPSVEDVVHSRRLMIDGVRITNTAQLTGDASLQTNNELPSALEMGKNFAKAAITHASTGMKNRTEEEANQLVTEFCEKCPHYRPEDKRCTKCGCFLSIKTAWKSQHCPIGKW